MKKWLKHLKEFRPDGAGPQAVLGELEAAVMEVFWRRGDSCIKDVHDALAATRQIAYTTVQTTVERLCRKGLVSRRGHGRTFTYLAAVGKDEFLACMAKRVLGALFGNFPEPTLASLVDVLGGGDKADAEALLDAIRRRRESAGDGE